MAAALVLLVNGGTLVAQAPGPTILAARAALSAPASPQRPLPAAAYAAPSCGSAWKNAALLGLGLSLATAVIELTYTIVREPFVRNGHDVPGADPTIIAWAGGAGFLAGLIGTEMCRRRR